MLCPFCGSDSLKVIDKRNASDLLIRRRRECDSCNKRFTTYERITESEIFVLKKDGFKEKFNSEKLKRGIILACKKRPVTIEQIDNIIMEIEHILRRAGESEFNSDYIGNLILDRLRKIDDISYIRYASIFRKFETIQDFSKEILHLQEE